MKWWVTEECVLTEAQGRLCLYLAALYTGGVVLGGCGVVMDEDRAREGRGMKYNEDEGQRSPGQPGEGGRRVLRQRWRDWESRKNKGQRETNLLSKLLMFAPLCCTVASHLNLHFHRQYQVSVPVLFCEGQHVAKEKNWKIPIIQLYRRWCDWCSVPNIGVSIWKLNKFNINHFYIYMWQKSLGWVNMVTTKLLHHGEGRSLRLDFTIVRPVRPIQICINGWQLSPLWTSELEPVQLSRIF